jgi:phage terminase large subunit-like protein
LADLAHGHRRGLRYDHVAASVAVDFFKLLRHSKGQWAGETFELQPWQHFVLGNLFGWLRRDGRRRFRVGHMEVARKNGKTTFAAGVGHKLFLLDGESGAEVYTVATKRDQARITHEEAKRMVRSSPSLAQRVTVFKDNLYHAKTNSKYEPLGADANTMDGLNPHGVLADEVHAWRDRHLWDVMETASGARTQPLTLITTTAGYDRHSIWWELRELAIRAVLARGPDDDGFDDSRFAYIACPDDGDDWTDESTWIKGNPSLGVTVQLDELREQCAQARITPGKQNAFRRYRLNLPTEQAKRWIDMDLWDANTGDHAADDLARLLEGESCWAGLDLSATTDLTALVLYFDARPDGRHPVLCWFFMPRETARAREQEDRTPYTRWADLGLLTLTPGNAVDYDSIRRLLTGWPVADDDDALHTPPLAERYHIRGIGIDPWNATQLALQLQQDGMDVQYFRQGFASMSQPAKKLVALVADRKLAHAGHPVLRLNVANAACDEDAAGNVKPSKGRSTGRIDGLVALLNAIGISGAATSVGGSVYDSQELEVI